MTSKNRGKIIASHPISTAQRKEFVDIRLNSHNGLFSADLDGETYSSHILSDLREKISNIAEISDRNIYKPYIVISLTDYSKFTDIEDSVDIRSSMELFLIKSDAEGFSEAGFRAKVDDDGSLKCAAEHAEMLDQDAVIVPYTLERMDSAARLIADLKRTCARVGSVFSNDSEIVARLLDAMVVGD